MIPKKPFSTPRLTIRAFRPEDGGDLFAYLSDARVYRYEPGEPVDRARAAFLAADLANRPDFWAVELRAEAKVIGQLYFNHCEPGHLRTWELGYILSPHYQQQGYMSEAAAALVEYGFSTRQVHRIEAQCSPDNTASWKLLEKIGFQREGRLRQNIFFRRDAEGQPLWMDSYVYGRLASDGLEAGE